MSKGKTKKQAREAQLWWVIGVLAVAVMALVVTVLILLSRPTTTVSNFDQCKQAGGAIMESYPEQCRYGDQTYTNDVVKDINKEYVGMTEQNALAQAAKDNVTARVVEREGESLPVTADYMYGRCNMYVKDGKVYKVMIEGQE